MEKENKELESALAQAHLKLLTYESLIEVAEENLGIDFKKNFKIAIIERTKQKSKEVKTKAKIEQLCKTVGISRQDITKVERKK